MDIRELVDYELPNTLGVHEYIHSYLVEHPKSYWLIGNRTELYYLDREFGLLHMSGDYLTLTHEDISDYVTGVLEMIRNSNEGESNE